MSIFKNFFGRLEGRLVSLFVSNQSFANQFLDELREVRPGDIARRENIEMVLREYGDQVLNLLSESQCLAVLERMCKTKLPEVITLVNLNSSGTFKYVGDGEVRVIIGSGSQRLEGWLATDIDKLNIVEESSWRRLFKPGSIDRLLAEHVFEHLSLRELRDALAHIHRYMKPGGMLRLAVPDAFHPSRYYYNLVKPGGWETPYEHMLFLEHEMLSRVANEIGFEVRLIEYFDDSGIFHGTNYRSEDGVIQRCARNNAGLDTNDAKIMSRFYESIPEHLRQQFYDKHISYTSLIVDLVKPE